MNQEFGDFQKCMIYRNWFIKISFLFRKFVNNNFFIVIYIAIKAESEKSFWPPWYIIFGDNT